MAKSIKRHSFSVKHIYLLMLTLFSTHVGTREQGVKLGNNEATNNLGIYNIIITKITEFILY